MLNKIKKKMKKKAKYVFKFKTGIDVFMLLRDSTDCAKPFLLIYIYINKKKFNKKKNIKTGSGVLINF